MSTKNLPELTVDSRPKEPCKECESHWTGPTGDDPLSIDIAKPEDACLIAAAPDLLEALEKAERWLSKVTEVVELHTGIVPDELKQIREAIAKAKGEF